MVSRACEDLSQILMNWHIPIEATLKVDRTQNPMPNHSRTATDSAQEYLRGIVGGLLFSLPMLYTMEVWWAGLLFDEVRLMSMLAFTLLLLLLYNSYAGVHPERSFGNVLLESIEELGIGLVLSATILFLLGRIQWQDPLGEVLGKVVIEAMLVAIGVSVGTAQLGNPEEDEEEPSDDTDPASRSILGRIALALCGTVMVAGNIAPTDEVVMLGLQSSAPYLLALLALSVGLTAIVLFFSEFKATGAPDGEEPSLHQYVLGIGLAYGVALIASSLLLWLFGRFDGKTFQECLDLVVILALPGSLGASAGSLLIR